MTRAVIASFSFTVIGRSRDDCIETMDNTALGILNHIGGAPWITVDDDVKKLQNPQASIADDQGFLYQGTRSCQFGGPYLDTGTQTYHDGFKPQIQVAG